MNKIHNHTSHLGAIKFRLIITMALNFIITIAEVIGGILSGSLSLISDALHNFSDGISVILSYIAIKLKDRPFSSRHTFGLKRAEILAAVLNSTVLLGISIYLFYEAGIRFFRPHAIEGSLMTIVASIGFVANIVGTLLLKKDAHTSLNIKSAYLHLLADAISSVGVILGGLAIYFWKIYWIDPLLTILIGLYILKEGYQILSEAIHILMEGAPAHISLEEIKQEVESFDEVQNIHHTHIWTVGENDIHIEAHINVNEMLVSQSHKIHESIEQVLQQKFGIQHVTLQFECDLCADVGMIINKQDE